MRGSPKLAVFAAIASVGLLATAAWELSHDPAPPPSPPAIAAGKLPEPATTPAAPTPTPTVTPTPTPTTQALAAPITDFKPRITKKFFGTFVTPATSPVQPERFQGYHLGDDVEYGDTAGTVPIYAISDGSVAYSGWVSGYGGVTVLHQLIRGSQHTVLYGHLAPDSLLAVGTHVSRGQTIGRLGLAYSHETDGERRHLHFSIRADDQVVLLGYVQSQSQLSGWLDPLGLY